MSPRLLKSALILGCFTVLGAAGCGTNPPPAAPTTTSPNSNSTASTVPTLAPGDAKASALKFASDFLTSAKAGQAKAELLTVDFKKAIAEPVFDADREKGYSDSAAGQWLASQGEILTNTTPRIDWVGGDAAFAVAAGQGGGRAVLRLVRAGSSWAVDWFHVASKTATDLDLAGTADEAGAKLAAVALLDTAARRQLIAAESVLTLAAKSRYAPPFGSDKDRGYSRSILKTKLEDLVGTSTGVAEQIRILGTIKDGTATKVSLELLAGSTKKMVTVKAIKGSRAGEWLVEEWDAK
jgi:hypothetical protein